MLSVCTKGLRVTQFQFSVCMYGTCGRIDNKADFDFLTLTYIIMPSMLAKTICPYTFLVSMPFLFSLFDRPLLFPSVAQKYPIFTVSISKPQL